MTKEFDVDLNIGIYDGDTSHSERARLRDSSRLVILKAATDFFFRLDRLW